MEKKEKWEFASMEVVLWNGNRFVDGFLLASDC